MNVSSPVGEFPFRVTGVSVRGGHVRLEGAMGAWPSHVEIGPADLPDLARVVGGGRALAAVAAAGIALVALRRAH